MPILEARQIENAVTAAGRVLREGAYFRCSAGDIYGVKCSVRGALARGEALAMLAYWGIARRSGITSAEREALTFQRRWLDRLRSVTSMECTIHYLLTDTHAYINGVDPATVESYATEAAGLLEASGFTAELMTGYLCRHGVDKPMRHVEAGFREGADWLAMPAGTRRELERLASVHCTAALAADGARRYYAANCLEAAVVCRVAGAHLFLTYMPESMSFVLPPLVTIRTFVGPRNLTRRPWFAAPASVE